MSTAGGGGGGSDGVGKDDTSWEKIMAKATGDRRREGGALFLAKKTRSFSENGKFKFNSISSYARL